MTVPPYSFQQAFSAWHFDAAATGFIVVVATFYAWRVRRAGARGVRWPWWRGAAFLVLGLGGVVVCTMSSLAVYQHAVLWAFVVQLTVLMTVVPVALATGDPVGLVRAGCSERSRARLDGVLNGPVARVLTFPLVAAVLGVIFQMVVFFGPVLAPALRHAWLMDLVYLAALVVGSLLAWPLIGDDLLPAWVTPPLRMLFAALDGLVDAIPGIALVASGTLIADGYFGVHRPSWLADPLADQHLSGTLAVAVAEVVALPLLIVLFFQWASAEMRVPRGVVADTGVESVPTEAADEGELERPWWETDPRFGRRTEEFRPRRGR